MKVPTRQSAAIGVLMNTRGLTELVILNVGRQLGVLDDELFTMLVLMALITTAMTGPLLKRVYSDRVMQRDIAAAERRRSATRRSTGCWWSTRRGSTPGPRWTRRSRSRWPGARRRLSSSP